MCDYVYMDGNCYHLLFYRLMHYTNLLTNILKILNLVMAVFVLVMSALTLATTLLHT